MPPGRGSSHAHGELTVSAGVESRGGSTRRSPQRHVPRASFRSGAVSSEITGDSTAYSVKSLVGLHKAQLPLGSFSGSLRTHSGTTPSMNDQHTPRPAWNPLTAFGLALGVS